MKAAERLANLLAIDMTTQQCQVEHVLFDIEVELRRLDYWQESPPSAEELSSTLPFCHDTLAFPQWLQFIFLQRMRILLYESSPLPINCAITPYAEEYFKQLDVDTQTLLALLTGIDKLLSSNS